MHIAHCMFQEVASLFRASGLLYTDVKLENALLRRGCGQGGGARVMMADYGSLFPLGAAPCLFTYVSPANVYLFQERTVQRTQATWGHVAFGLGVSLGVLLSAPFVDTLRDGDRHLDRLLENQVEAFVGAQNPALAALLRSLLQFNVTFRLTQGERCRATSADDVGAAFGAYFDECRAQE